MSSPAKIFIVDDDQGVRDSLGLILERAGYVVESYESAESFLTQHQECCPCCLLLDVRMDGMSGLVLQQRLADRQIELPIIFMSGHADVPTSVTAMRGGAVDFLEKPFRREQLLERVQEAIQNAEQRCGELVERRNLLERLARLTPREREVMSLVVEGRSNKEIGRILGTSHRTVDVHRARVMEKMDVGSPQELATLATRHKLYPSEK